MADRRSVRCDHRATKAARGTLESPDGRIGRASAAIRSDGRSVTVGGKTFAAGGRRIARDCRAGGSDGPGIGFCVATIGSDCPTTGALARGQAVAEWLLTPIWRNLRRSGPEPRLTPLYPAPPPDETDPLGRGMALGRKNLRWGDPSYELQPGDVGYVAEPPISPSPQTQKNPHHDRLRPPIV